MVNLKCLKGALLWCIRFCQRCWAFGPSNPVRLTKILGELGRGAGSFLHIPLSFHVVSLQANPNNWAKAEGFAITIRPSYDDGDLRVWHHLEELCKTEALVLMPSVTIACEPNKNETDLLQIDCGCSTVCRHDVKQLQVVFFEVLHTSHTVWQRDATTMIPSTRLHPHFKPNLTPT
jgi:hypothetical protein